MRNPRYAGCQAILSAMPLFTTELNARADVIARAGRVWLHTAAPTNGSPTTGRTSQGGGAYEAGFAITAANWTAASSGDVNISIACDFGTADEAVGTVTHWSFDPTTGADGLFGTLPNTVIANGDSFSINAGTIQANGATT